MFRNLKREPKVGVDYHYGDKTGRRVILFQLVTHYFKHVSATHVTQGCLLTSHGATWCIMLSILSSFNVTGFHFDAHIVFSIYRIPSVNITRLWNWEKVRYKEYRMRYREVTSENQWQLTSQVTKKSLFTVTNVLFYFLHAIYLEHIVPLQTIVDRSFRHCR